MEVAQGPHPGSGQVGFVVDKVARGQVFSEYFGFPCQSSFHQLLHNHPPLSSGAGTIGQKWPQYKGRSPIPLAIKIILCYNSSLESWMVVNLTNRQVQASYIFYAWLRLEADTQKAPFVLVSNLFHGNVFAQSSNDFVPRICLCVNVFTDPLSSNGGPLWLHYSGFRGWCDITTWSVVCTTGYKEDDELMN
jgi:hypothetical protein